MLQKCLDGVKTGVDPDIYAVKDKTKWYKIATKEQFFAVLDSLNNRGLREQVLLTNLNNDKSQIVDYFMECEKQEEKSVNKKPPRIAPSSKKSDPNQIDKTLFKCMEDYVEGSLRDQILDLEERIWIASFGNSKIEDRDQWRWTIEQGMLKLISNTPESVNNNPKTEADVAENGKLSNDLVNGNYTDADLSNEAVANGSDATTEPMDVDSPVVKAIPLHLKESVDQGNNRSRCSTPVDDSSESEKINFVKELSQALLQVMKFLG